MHPVIQSILNRQNLSGPFNDGKKINLVLFGGIMMGVTGGATVIALEELGLTNAFDNIFVVSAGLPNASYFLSKQTKLGTSIYYENLNRRKFINFFKFWNPADVNKVVEAIRDIKPLDVEKVLSSSTQIFVRLFDPEIKKIKYLNLSENCKNKHDYFSMLKSSILFFTKNHQEEIDGEKFIDGAMCCGFGNAYIRNHVEYAMSHDYTDLLIIYPNKKYSLNIGSDKICEIILPGELGKFETDEKVLKRECLKAGLCVKQAFGKNEGITL